jgi:fructose-bisphosphate aldolase, class II
MGVLAMPLVSMNEMLSKALHERYAIGQFNVNNLEFTQAILQAAEEEKSPVILGVSEPYVPYLGGFPFVVAMVKTLIDHFQITVPVALHLDHGQSFNSCMKAMAAGFTSVMIDASHYQLDENIALTKKVADAAYTLGITVEAEVGRISGREDDLVVDEADSLFAIPQECERFIRETGVDCFAPALGSVHGPYRVKPNLQFDRMEKIQQLTGVPLVLHGGSGIPSVDIQRAISLGTAKINVNTENQMASTAAIRRFLIENPDEYDPRKYLGLSRETVKDTVKAKMREFGCSGQAERLK